MQQGLDGYPVSICLYFKLGLALGVELAARWLVLALSRDSQNLRDKFTGYEGPSYYCYKEPWQAQVTSVHNSLA